MMDQGMIYAYVLGGTEQDGTRFHYATQNNVQLKTYELIVLGIFSLVVSDRG